MPEKEITFNVVTRSRLVSAAEGQDLMRLIVECVPGTAAAKMGNLEPLRDRFALERVPEFWDDYMFIWEGQASEGIVHQAVRRDGFGGILAWFEREAADETALITLIREACERSNAEFALIHLSSKKEIRRGVQTAVNELDLGGGIPDLYWATVFGPSYVEFFGRDRLLSAPVYRVDELGAERIYLQLSEHLSDFESEWKQVNAVRDAVKEHLGRDAFVDPRRWRPRPARVPPAFAPPLPAPPSAWAGRREDIGDEMRKLAAAFVKAGAEEGEVLDYSESSLARVNNMIDELWGDPETGKAEERFLETMAPVVGAYVGEVIVRDLGGSWKLDPEEGIPAVRSPTGVRAFPVAKAEKRFLNGHEDDLSFYYKVIKDMWRGSRKAKRVPRRIR